MPSDTALLGNLASTPKKLLRTEERTESVVLAQAGGTTTQSPPPTSVPGTVATVLITLAIAAIVLGIVVWILQNWRNLGPATSQQYVSDSSGEIPAREFAVDIVATNARTQDYLRANIQATIYVYIPPDKESQRKAVYFLSDEETETISPENVTTAVKKRAEAALRGAASEKTLENLHLQRQEFSEKIASSLNRSLAKIGLAVSEVIIGDVEENDNYNPNNYFDAKVMTERAKGIQSVIRQTRMEELKTEQELRKQELEAEKGIRQIELDTEKEIREKELAIGREIEDKEIEFHKQSLEDNKEIEKAKIEQEKEIELHRLKVEAEIQTSQEQENSKVEIEKIKQDMLIAEENKKLQLQQAELHKDVETKEIDAIIAVLQKEKARLEAESERATAEEAVNTAIEEEKAQRRQKTAEISALTAQDEATAITTLAAAEGVRYKAIPPTDAVRISQVVQELAPQLLEKLPELAKALAPQPGVLGDSNVYSFPGGNGEGVNQLMLSTSGMLLLNALMEGKLGKLVEQTVNSMKDDKNGQTS